MQATQNHAANSTSNVTSPATRAPAASVKRRGCIRSVAYDSDNLEYVDTCYTVGSGACQEHDDGRISAMTMWEQLQALAGSSAACGSERMSCSAEGGCVLRQSATSRTGA